MVPMHIFGVPLKSLHRFGIQSYNHMFYHVYTPSLRETEMFRIAVIMVGYGGSNKKHLITAYMNF